MRRGIEETDKSFVFYTSIFKYPVKVTLALGWIWIEHTCRYSTWWSSSRKRTERMTFTSEDARNLIAAIQELIPKEECEKATQD